MAESAVSSASKWIGKLVVEEIKYLNQVSENMKELQSELQWMLCFLQDADQQRYKKAVLEQWVSQIKEHAYDAEDLIDKYMVKVSEQAKGRSNTLISTQTLVRYLCIVRNWSALRNVGSEMDSLTLKISKLAERLQRYGVQINKGVEDGLLATQDHKHVRRTFAEHPAKDSVIGRKDDIDLLVKRLQSKENKEKVIAIIGLGGLGKTTLAEEVYGDASVKKHFVSFSRPSAPKTFDTDSIMKSITKDLIKGIHNKDCYEKLDCKCPQGIEESDDIKKYIREKNFTSAVYAIMKKRNCLVLIDDVWSFEDFDKLRIAFPKVVDKTGSRVMLTGCKESIVQGLDSLVFIHKPEGLKQEDSMDLFKMKFGKLPEDDETKMKLIEDMLYHCGGMPLAITALAAVLKRKQKVEEWEAVSNNVSFYLGAAIDPNQPSQNVYDVLGTSYADLPSHLKPCFLHLANFPEDHEIKTNVLFKLWLAEGLVTLPYRSPVDMRNHPLREEDIAESYLNELAARSMIRVLELEETSGKIRTFQLHGLMRDVCMLKATEEGFLHHLSLDDFYVTDDQTTTSTSNFKTTVNRPANITLQHDRGLRRLAVQMNDKDQDDVESSQPSDDSPAASTFPYCLFSSSSSPTQAKELIISAPGLRSLIFFPIGYDHDDYDCSPLLEKICKAFPLLRVLEFHDAYNIRGIVPRKLGHMTHLRYLGFRGTNISLLPSSIGNLKYLQTLDLRVEYGTIITVPNVLWKMNLLKHLYLPKSRYDESGVLQESYKIEGKLKLRLDGLTHLETLRNIDLDRTDMENSCSFLKMKSLAGSSTIGTLEDFQFLIQSPGINDVKLLMHSRLIKEDSQRILSETKIQEAHILFPKDDTIGNPIGTLKLDAEMFPQCIARLYFTNITFEEDPMPVLGALENLEELELSGCRQLKGLRCSKGSFPKLTYLILGGISNWEWEIEDGALPLLDELEMNDVQFATGRLPAAIRPSVLVNCYPCVNGLENQDRPCPNADTEDDEDEDEDEDENENEGEGEGEEKSEVEVEVEVEVEDKGEGEGESEIKK